ncbi:MAG: hypothetical protein PHQ98_04010 [Candidatus ainarchaeum sp.]|nr:hypothetical protein [Candidatus ainarchaeum sp.]
MFYAFSLYKYLFSQSFLNNFNSEPIIKPGGNNIILEKNKDKRLIDIQVNSLVDESIFEIKSFFSNKENLVVKGIVKKGLIEKGCLTKIAGEKYTVNGVMKNFMLTDYLSIGEEGSIFIDTNKLPNIAIGESLFFYK